MPPFDTPLPDEGYQKLPPADLSAPLDYRGFTYLHLLCAEGGSPRQIRRAIEAGAPLDALSLQGLPPLATAIRYGAVEAVAELLKAGARTAFETPRGHFFNACHIAVIEKKPEILALLLQTAAAHTINRDGVDASGVYEAGTALHVAARLDRPDMIEMLIKAGARLNAPAPPQGLTPLMFAIIHGCPDSFDSLLRHAPDVHAATPAGATALHVAAQHNKSAMAKLLLKKGADLNRFDSNGKTPLMLAIEGGHTSVVEALVNAGADPNLRDPRSGNRTALHFAAAKGQVYYCRLMLKAGADPLLADSFNRTALMTAESERSHAVAQELRTAENEAQAHANENTYRRLRRGNEPKRGGPTA